MQTFCPQTCFFVFYCSHYVLAGLIRFFTIWIFSLPLMPLIAIMLYSISNLSNQSKRRFRHKSLSFSCVFMYGTLCNSPILYLRALVFLKLITIFFINIVQSVVTLVGIRICKTSQY